MAGPAHGYSRYGLNSGFFEFPPNAGVRPISEPPRHSTSSSAPWQGGPYASLPPIPRPAAPSSYGGYGEGCSGYAPWYAPPMGNDPASSAVPGHPRARSQSRRQAASPVPDQSSNNDSMASDGGDDDLSSKGSIRAKWDDVRTEIFCHLWLEEQQKGNCLQGKMSAIGWCNMVAAFKERTGWAHSKNQLHTRYRQLKKYYGVLKILKRGTGGGRRKHGGFKAAPDIWDALKKKLSEVERLKREEPSWLWMLDDMFRDATIDYSTMLATAGEPNTDNVDSHDTTAADSISPRTTSGSCKRGSSEATKSTADSPSKKAQAPMSPSSSITPKKKKKTLLSKFLGKVAAQQELTTKALAQLSVDQNQRKHEEKQAYRQCLQLAVDCGIDPNSDEYFFLTSEFENETCREAFLLLQTNEARWGWIQRAFLQHRKRA